ncbi:MAG TPA: TonB-dependent receptor plug domain-containing protein [Opitutaceae bacterium]|nr:TonB-dependent receptor plug domain-containing protein [Opitutaceae bacterium]
MKDTPTRVALLCSGLAAALAVPASGQTESPVLAPKTGDNEVVVLPQFEVNENKENPYRSQVALSASRVATSIQDIPQTISVITSEFLRDSLGARMLDAAKYVTPISESTLAYGADRYTIRGFAVSHEFIDGMEISGADGYSMSLAPYNIERVEILKGPNAILVPGGSPGGQMNPITKSPFGRNAQSLTLELGQYYGNAVSVDVNQVLGPKVYARLVAAYWRNDNMYFRNQFRRGYQIAPSISYQINDDHKLTVKAEFVDNHEMNLGGVPLDPAAGTGDKADIARGLPRNWTFGSDNDDRLRQTQRLTAELLSTLGDHVSSRLMVAFDHVKRVDTGGTGAAISGGGGGSVNPFTGEYEPGVTWNTAAYNADTTGTVVLTATPAPVTDPSTWVYTRNTGKEDIEYWEAHVKNDYALSYKWSWISSKTIAGFSANRSDVHRKSYRTQARPSVAANALDSITFPDWVFLPILNNTAGGTAQGVNKEARQKDLQIFALETLGFLDDRVLVSGGISRFFGELTRTDTTRSAEDAALLNTVPTYNLTSNAVSVGLVVKPIESVSLFANRNTTGGTMPGSLSAGAVAPSLKLAQGSQREYGVKTTQLGGRLTASLAYFDIKQSNYAVTNSLYYELVAQGRYAEAAALPPLYLDINSKGWEFETSFAVNENLTFLGNFTNYRVRQPGTDARVRGVADRTWAVYADYNFTSGPLKGFGVNIGVDFRDKAAGDNVTGYTTNRYLPDGTIMGKQPTFMLPDRTLVNLGFAYKAKEWTARVQIANLFNEEYLQSATSRSNVIVGEPISVKGSFTYNF